MDAARFARVKEILLRVLEADPANRDERLHELSGGDVQLRAEVLELLEQQSARARLVETGAVGLAGAAELQGAVEEVARRRDPKQIGPYEVLGRLGEGGMGVVYRARQSEPIEREVAIKLIRAGYAQERIVARFEWERRSLARMDHPNIAKVFDAGADERGNPYVVMELVDGDPIDQYCRTHELSLRERVQLFLQTCRGVQHAHERGVLHRDLKPGNILVRQMDGGAMPTIIDFGIAKALDPDPVSEEMLTREDQRIGTPSYMSPEQLRGDSRAIDIRSDVYALGVILYELLAGRHPFEKSDANLDELSRRRSEEAVALPSSEPKPNAADETARRFRRELRGDLDTICLKAVRPEAARRYPTVAQFIDDLERFLEDRPISARPDSVSYRLGKLRRRHPVLVALSSAMLFFVLAGVAFLFFHADRLQRERDRANAQAAKAEATASFLEGLFTEVDPTKGGASELSARELLDEGAKRLRADLMDQPQIRASMLQVVGRVYHGLALHDRSEEAVLDALAALEEVAPSQERQMERGELHVMLGTVYHDQGRREPSEQAYARAVEFFRAGEPHGGTRTALALSYLATSIQSQGRLEDAIPLLDEAIRMGTASNGASHPDVIWSQNMLGYIYFKRGQYAAALELFESILRQQRALIDGDDVDLAHTLNNLGGMYYELERLEEAEATWAECLAMNERIYGDSHPVVARSLHQLAKVMHDTARFDEAESYSRRAVEMNNTMLGESHRNSTSSLAVLARVRESQGAVIEAEQQLRRVVALRTEELGPADDITLRGRRELAEFLLRQGRDEEARPILQDLLRLLSGVQGDQHPVLNQLRVVAAELALKEGEMDRARELLLLAGRPLETAYGPEHSWRRRWVEANARLASARG